MSGTRVGIGLLLAIALAAAAARMLSAGLYGLTLFLLLPMVLGD